MSLVEMIDGLIDDIGTGLNEATIRSRLLTMREQAEAVDTALKKGEAALEECNSALHDACSDLERFKANAETEKLPPYPSGLQEDAIRILRLLFQLRRTHRFAD
jgi:hypothetical protein